MIIKICGITQVEDAKYAIQQGAHWIGIIQHPASPRHVSWEQAKRIADAVHSVNGVAVGVFVNTEVGHILDFIQYTGITHIQLHGSTSRQQHARLPQNIVRIYVREVTVDGLLLPDIEAGQASLEPARDYLLLDSQYAGTGQAYAWNRLVIPDMRFLVAGGLRPDNVATAISCLQPQGVDVSSGVESSVGIKDRSLIQKFIKTVQSLDRD